MVDILFNLQVSLLCLLPCSIQCHRQVWRRHQLAQRRRDGPARRALFPNEPVCWTWPRDGTKTPAGDLTWGTVLDRNRILSEDSGPAKIRPL